MLDRSALCEAVARAAQRSVTRLGCIEKRAEQLEPLRGGVDLAAALGLVKGKADSPLERRWRRRLRAAGFDPHPGGHPVPDEDGNVVAMVKIALPAERVAIEADGFAYHATPSLLRADHERQNGPGELLERRRALIGQELRAPDGG